MLSNGGAIRSPGRVGSTTGPQRNEGTKGVWDQDPPAPLATRGSRERGHYEGATERRVRGGALVRRLVDGAGTTLNLWDIGRWAAPRHPVRHATRDHRAGALGQDNGL